MLTKINGWIAECDWCGKKNTYTVYDKPFPRVEEIDDLVETGWYIDDNKNELVCPACQKKARRNLEAILNIAYTKG